MQSMNESIISRVHAGVPAGGQFSSHDRAESSVSIAETRRDWSQLQWTANNRAFEQAEFAAVSVVNTLRAVAPSAATARFVRRFDDDETLRLDALLDEHGNEINDLSLFSSARGSINVYLEALQPKDAWLLGDDDEEQPNHDRAVKHVDLREDSIGQEDVEKRLRLALAAADVNHHDSVLPLLATLTERFQADDNTAAIDALHALTSDDILDLYENQIGPMLDQIEQIIAARAAGSNS